MVRELASRFAGRREQIARAFGRTVALVCLWIVLAEGEVDHPIVAALALLAASLTMIGAGLEPGPQVSFVGALRFVPMFVASSLRGGVDVAVRAFRPGSLDPALICHRQRLPADGPEQALFAAVISLLPGTLCAAIDGRELSVHVIDRTRDPHAQLAELERRVAALFGEPPRERPAPP